MLTPRPYQREAVDAVFDYWRTEPGNPLAVLGTGLGKGLCVAMLNMDLLQGWSDMRVVNITHVAEIVEQNYLELMGVWPNAPAGVYSAGLGRRDAHAQIIFAGIQTIWNKVNQIGWVDCVIVDECFSGDTEVLTENGFQRFDELDKSAMVAQFDQETETISFAYPSRYVQRKAVGDVFQMKSENGGDYIMTGSHEVPYSRSYKGVKSADKRQLKDMSFSSMNKFYAGGNVANIPANDNLKAEERFWIAFQADGNLHRVNKNMTSLAYFTFAKERKITEFLKLMDELGYSWSEISGKEAHDNFSRKRRFSVKVPYIIEKNIDIYFDLKNISSIKARDIISCMNGWDGHIASKNCWLYTNTDKRAVDFYQAVAFLAGYSCVVRKIEDTRSDKFSDCYRLFITHSTSKVGTQSYSRKKIDYQGEVYCVTVPKGNIVVRRGGKAIVLGNCHLVSPKSDTMYGKFFSSLRQLNPDMKIVGFTATDYRMDSGRLAGQGRMFDKVIYEYNLAEGIEDGYLAPITTKGTQTEYDLAGVGKRGGEYVPGALQTAVNKQGVTRAAVAEMIRAGHDRRSWLAFCAGVDHATAVRDEARDNGVSAEVLTGETPKAERREMLAAYKGYEFTLLSNVSVASIGFNHKGVDLVAFMRPTMSVSLYLQMVGRSVRPLYAPGFDQNNSTADERKAAIAAGPKPNALILDFAKLIQKHGPVDRIQVGEPGSGNGEAPVKECPDCQELVHISVMTCPDCGHVFPPSEDLKYTAKAEAAPILASDPPEWVPVDARTFNEHPARDFGNPPSVKITYAAGMRRINEWMCPQHGEHPVERSREFPVRKADKYWKLHGGQEPCPRTVEEWIGRAAELDNTDEVQISYRRNPKYPDVRSYRVSKIVA